MRYQWDLSELNIKLEILKQCYQEMENEKLKEVIAGPISSYQEMLSLAVKKKNEKHSLLDDSIEFHDFHEFLMEYILAYQDNDSTILNTILQSYLPFKKEYRSNTPLEKVKICNTNEEVINITRDFIKKYIPTSFHQSFDFLFHSSKNENKLQLSYSPNIAMYGGITYIDPFFKEKYIYAARKNNLLDLGITPHEALHYLITDFDDYKTKNYNTYYLLEAEGSFANILFGDYFYNHSIEFKNYFNLYQLQTYESQICDLVIGNALLDSLTEKGRFRMNKFNKQLEVYDIMPFINKEEVMEYMTIPMDINMKYGLGFLVAIDLFYIYQKDPEFSFYLLKNIHFIKKENDIISLLRRNHITFMDDGYENLKKYVKKIERQN